MSDNDRQTDSSEGSQMDAGQLPEPKPAEIVRTGPERVWGWLLLTGFRDRAVFTGSVGSVRPYLGHLWLQHQRLRTHPGNVYVDLTATWERKVLDVHSHTHLY